MSVSRNTVAKYLKHPEPKRKAALKRAPVTEMVPPRIEQILSEWRGRTTPKQRITGTRTHRQLIEEGYEVGITTVRDYLREKRRKEAEVFVPLIHRPGDEAQVDFFEVSVEEDGQMKKGMEVRDAPYVLGKGLRMALRELRPTLFPRSHVLAFSYLGGVPRRIVYDNLSAAVKKVLRSERELTERFRALVSHYLFEPCFTRPGEGHDKGGVEARGKGIRLAHLTPIPRGATLSEISEVLLREVEMAFTSEQRFVEEQRLLRELLERPFEARQVELV
jgi:transposase